MRIVTWKEVWEYPYQDKPETGVLRKSCNIFGHAIQEIWIGEEYYEFNGWEEIKDELVRRYGQNYLFCVIGDEMYTNAAYAAGYMLYQARELIDE